MLKTCICINLIPNTNMWMCRTDKCSDVIMEGNAISSYRAQQDWQKVLYSQKTTSSWTSEWAQHHRGSTSRLTEESSGLRHRVENVAKSRLIGNIISRWRWNNTYRVIRRGRMRDTWEHSLGTSVSGRRSEHQTTSSVSEWCVTTAHRWKPLAVRQLHFSTIQHHLSSLAKCETGWSTSQAMD